MVEYRKISKNFARGAGRTGTYVGGGCSCEVAYSTGKGKIDGTYRVGVQARKFPEGVCDIKQVDKSAAPQSVRVGIPRVLTGLYEIRKQSGLGHVGARSTPTIGRVVRAAAVQWSVMIDLCQSSRAALSL